MTRIYLVRHGETAPNKDGVALGQMDVPLTELGRWQAERLAAALSRRELAAVYSSPLQRALDTAAPISAALRVETVVAHDLAEMNIGVLDGMKYTEIREKYPDLMAQWASKSGPDTWMPGGERLRDVAVRSWDVLVGISRRHDDEDVVAVTHNFVILTALARALGFELAQFRQLQHSVAAISVLEIRGERASVVSLNDTCHLHDS